MMYDADKPNHSFFADWEKPQEIKITRPFVSQRGEVNEDKVYEVAQLKYQNHTIEVCIDGEKVWIKKC